MTTLTNITNAARDHARAAQQAAQDAVRSAQVAVAPVAVGLAETQHEVETQGAALDETHGVAEAAQREVAALQNAVEILILDALMGGGNV